MMATAQKRESPPTSGLSLLTGIGLISDLEISSPVAIG